MNTVNTIVLIVVVLALTAGYYYVSTKFDSLEMRQQNTAELLKRNNERDEYAFTSCSKDISYLKDRLQEVVVEKSDHDAEVFKRLDTLFEEVGTLSEEFQTFYGDYEMMDESVNALWGIVNPLTTISDKESLKNEIKVQEALLKELKERLKDAN